MKCPFCRQSKTEIYNSRRTRFGNQIWRRRRCLNCRQTFTTYEATDLGFLRVQPASGRPQPYSRYRLYASIAATFEPNRSQPPTADAVTDTVESKLLDLRTTLLTTSQIATTILMTLKALDTAAFLRYLASHTELHSSAELKRQLKNY